MNTRRRSRITLLALLAGALAGCARMPWVQPGPERGEPSPEPPARTSEPAADPPEPPADATAADEPARDAVRSIAVGEQAVPPRRRALARGERALDPDGVGYFMDVHEARLLQSLGESIRLRREGNGFRLLVAGRASFNTGSVRLRPFLRDELRSLAEVLAEFDNTLIVAHAHTDARGDEAYNRELSERRALRVAETLAEHGVSPARLVAVGHGETDPVADNDTPEGRARNRRLEIVVEAVVRSPDD